MPKPFIAIFCCISFVAPVAWVLLSSNPDFGLLASEVNMRASPQSENDSTSDHPDPEQANGNVPEKALVYFFDDT